MFQFRRFPTYTYLIQCTLTRYCRAGFPHSEISGSTLICSSPKLIAACRVLHRLLMPRHSPCALSSLTSSEEARSTPQPRFARRLCIRSLPLPLKQNVERFVCKRETVLPLLVHLTSCSQNYAGFTKDFLKLYFTLNVN